MDYTVRQSPVSPPLDGNWDAGGWSSAETGHVAHFRPESSVHRPDVRFRLLHSGEHIHGIFHVKDRFVRCVHEGFQAPVCRDSCVEFFFQPQVGEGYFNFEFSCGGSMLASYVRDCTRTNTGFVDFSMLTAEEVKGVRIWHSMPERVEPEITEPTEWVLQFEIPVRLLEPYSGPLGTLSGKTWRANFYKCGDETSHPHWGAWAPVDELNFHLPSCFEKLFFA